MEDQKIVELYWERSEDAISFSREKYDTYLMRIANNFLTSHEDCEECVSDAYLSAWDSIPPHRPEKLSLYLAKIVRQTAIDRFRRNNRQKRIASEYALSLDELGECLSGGDSTVEAVDQKHLAEVINRFVRELSSDGRIAFTRRYYFGDSVREIAAGMGCSQAKVKSLLHRTRQGLRKRLEKEGFVL